MASIISSVLLNNSVQEHMSAWLNTFKGDYWHWADTLLTEPLKKVIYYNEWTESFANERPGLFTITLLATVYTCLFAMMWLTHYALSALLRWAGVRERKLLKKE